MSKTIWIINQYASTPETGMGGRHYYLAKELAKQGHKVYLIAASYTHLLRHPPEVKNTFKIEPIAGFLFVWIKVSSYGEAHDKKRVWNWFSFAWKLRGLSKQIKESPDAILYSSPSLIPIVTAKSLARKYKCRFVWDIRDIWPLTLTELGGVSKKHPFIRLMQWIEDKSCKESDFILSNWPYAINYLKKQGADDSKFMWLPNGFYAEEFEQNEKLPQLTEEQLPKEKFIVGYTGTFGEANALEVIIDVANLLKFNLDIHFVLVGSGKLKPMLQEKIDLNRLSNVTLIEPIKKQQIPAMLSFFDVCYVGFKNSALYRFGNSLNKLPEYFMSGKPIVYSINSPFKPVDDAEAGITVPAETPQAIADAVLKLKNMTPEQRAKLGQNGRDYALKNHDYSRLSEKLSKVLLG